MTVYWGTHGALNANANPVALLLGDSWFWYPADDLAVEIGAGFPDKDFLVIGRNGSEAAEWSTKYRKEIDLAFKMYGQSVQALLLSGGGNDIAGMSDFLRIAEEGDRVAAAAAQAALQVLTQLATAAGARPGSSGPGRSELRNRPAPRAKAPHHRDGSVTRP